MTGGGTRLPVIGGVQPPAAAPGFERIAIIGLGTLGGSLAAAVRQAWPRSLVIGVDTRDVIETAMRLHAIDVGSDDLMIAGDADLVVLAGGVAESARVLPHLADAVASEAIVLALGGGSAVTERAGGLPGRLPLVLGLPAVELRGRGIHASSADLFRGRRWTITPITALPEAVERIHGLVRAVGGDPVAGSGRRPGGQADAL